MAKCDRCRRATDEKSRSDSGHILCEQCRAKLGRKDASAERGEPEGLPMKEEEHAAEAFPSVSLSVVERTEDITLKLISPLRLAIVMAGMGTLWSVVLFVLWIVTKKDALGILGVVYMLVPFVSGLLGAIAYNIISGCGGIKVRMFRRVREKFLSSSE